jgi:hypothetical protein
LTTFKSRPFKCGKPNPKPLLFWQKKKEKKKKKKKRKKAFVGVEAPKPISHFSKILHQKKCCW